MSQRTIRSVDSVRHCRISMFLGAKSGFGTTSLVSNLAVSLARRNKRILVIDSQCESPDIAGHCRISSAPALAALLSNQRTLRELVQTGPCGVDVLASEPESMHEQLTASSVKLVITAATTSDYDHVLIDAGDVDQNGYVSWLRSVHDIHIVSTCAPEAVMDCYSAMKTLAGQTTSARIRTLLNRCESTPVAENLHQRLALSASRFLNLALFCSGAITEEPAFHAALAAQRPLILWKPNCAASLQLNEIALQLDETVRPVTRAA